MQFRYNLIVFLEAKHNFFSSNNTNNPARSYFFQENPKRETKIISSMLPFFILFILCISNEMNIKELHVEDFRLYDIVWYYQHIH